MKQCLQFLSGTELVPHGCSTPTTGVIDRGNGVMTVTHQAPTAYHPTDPLKITATKEAGDYCASLGKKFIFLHSKET